MTPAVKEWTAMHQQRSGQVYTLIPYLEMTSDNRLNNAISILPSNKHSVSESWIAIDHVLASGWIRRYIFQPADKWRAPGQDTFEPSNRTSVYIESYDLFTVNRIPSSCFSGNRRRYEWAQVYSRSAKRGWEVWEHTQKVPTKSKDYLHNICSLYLEHYGVIPGHWFCSWLGMGKLTKEQYGGEFERSWIAITTEPHTRKWVSIMTHAE